MSSRAANERLVCPHVNCYVVSTGCLANLGVMRLPTKCDNPQERVQVSTSWFHFSLSTSGLRDVRISEKLWVT
jgi:hypothetical protein